MNIQIELQRRPEDYRLDNCVIDVVEEIPHDSFETFQNYPTARYGAITNSLHRLPEDTKDERHCILLLDADGDEGFIVNPHGAEYARYSAFVPNARQLCRLAQYPSLNRFSSDMEKLVEHFALEILRNQKDGRYQFSMNTVSDYYLEKFDGFLDRNLFLNMLSERPEIVEVEEYCDELTAKVKPAFCKTANVRNLSQKELDVICANHVLWLNDAGGEQADLSNCVLRGLFLRGRDLSNAYCNNTVFDDCNLDSVDFSSAELESARFTNCEMKDLFAVKTNFADVKCMKVPLEIVPSMRQGFIIAKWIQPSISTVISKKHHSITVRVLNLNLCVVIFLIFRTIIHMLMKKRLSGHLIAVVMKTCIRQSELEKKIGK